MSHININILLIDDNKIDNFFHERVIRKTVPLSHVAIANSGRQALDYLSYCKAIEMPRLIFLDVHMPGMDGWEFLEHFVLMDKKNTDITIVIMSSDSASERIEKHKPHFQKILFTKKPLGKEILHHLITGY